MVHSIESASCAILNNMTLSTNFFVLCFWNIPVLKKKRYCYLVQILKHKKLKNTNLKFPFTTTLSAKQLQLTCRIPTDQQPLSVRSAWPSPQPSWKSGTSFLIRFFTQKTSTNSTSCEETTDTTLLYPFLYCYQRCYRWICNFPF